MIQQPITASQARVQTKKNTYAAIERAINSAIADNRFMASVKCTHTSTEFTKEVIEYYQGRGFDCSFRFSDSVFNISWCEEYDG